MSHTNIIKRAFMISWRFRALWLFGFLLALCSGGGGGGGGNFNVPSGNVEEFDVPGMTPPLPDVEPQMVVAAIAGLLCLVLILAVIGAVVRVVTRTALIRMVEQIVRLDSVTMREGWQLGWSGAAWRLFLVGLVIGIPVAIISIIVLVVGLSPLLLLALNEEALAVAGILLTIFGVLIAVLVLIVLGAIITPILELSWRRTTLADSGVIASVQEAFQLIRLNLKDVFIIWLLMVGVGILWGLITLIVVLPISLIAAVLVGGVPAGLVYLLTNSGLGAAVTGIPLAVIALVLVTSVATGFYLIFQSAVWTLTYLDLKKPPVVEVITDSPPLAEADDAEQTISGAPQPQV